MPLTKELAEYLIKKTQTLRSQMSDIEEHLICQNPVGVDDKRMLEIVTAMSGTLDDMKRHIYHPSLVEDNKDNG
jgi:hypothetical protein